MVKLALPVRTPSSNLLALVMIIVGGGCGESPIGSGGPGAPPTPASLAGTWAFVSAKNVLYTVQAGQPTITNHAEPSQTDTGERTTISGTFTVSGANCRMDGFISQTSESFTGSANHAFTGTYEINGNTVTVIHTASGRRHMITASQEGNQLTLVSTYKGLTVTALFRKL